MQLGLFGAAAIVVDLCAILRPVLLTGRQCVGAYLGVPTFR